jgi:hypothetical protein
MSAVDNITRAWGQKASVRTWSPAFESTTVGLDYPLESLPSFEVADRALFDAASSSIATGLWLQYNWRTIQAEERIALPAIELLVGASVIDPQVKIGLLQTAVDEKYHTYFHHLAMRDAEQRYALASEYNDSVTVRELKQALAAESVAWRRNIIQVAYAVVAEVSINAFLEILSRAPSLRDANRNLVEKHNRDEGYHSVLFVAAAENLLTFEDARTRAFLRQCLADAKDSFLQHDFSMYQRVMSAHGITCEFRATSGMMTRDMSGVDRLLEVIDGPSP